MQLINRIACRLDDGLIQTEKPYCGSRKFGLSWVNTEGHLANVGTILEIERHMRLEDGRLAVNCRGEQRLLVIGPSGMQQVPIQCLRQHPAHAGIRGL